MLLIRRIGAVVLVVAAIVVIFAFKPPNPDHADRRGAISVKADLNNTSAEGAPQQAVVNGWEHSDYLALLSQQIDQAGTAKARDDRPLLLLGLCVAGIALIAFTTPTGPVRFAPTLGKSDGPPLARPSAGTPLHDPAPVRDEATPVVKRSEAPPT